MAGQEDGALQAHRRQCRGGATRHPGAHGRGAVPARRCDVHLLGSYQGGLREGCQLGGREGATRQVCGGDQGDQGGAGGRMSGMRRHWNRRGPCRSCRFVGSNL